MFCIRIFVSFIEIINKWKIVNTVFITIFLTEIFCFFYNKKDTSKN